MTTVTARNIFIGLFSLAMACSGGTTDSTSSSSGQPAGSGSGSTAGIGGVWDVSAFDDLAEGQMGQITIANGEITGTIPLKTTTSSALCHKTVHAWKFAISAAGASASGTITEDKKYEGNDCSLSQKAGELQSDVVATITGKRTTTRAGSLTDLNGVWELTVSGDNSKALTLTLDIDGGNFEGKELKASRGLKGSVVNNRATATADGFEFAAQRR